MATNKAALKLTVLLVSSLTIMSVITISPALPAMSADFEHIPNGQFIVQMVLTIPALFISLTSPLAGILIDRFGRLKLLYLAMVLYAIAGTSGFLPGKPVPYIDQSRNSGHCSGNVHDHRDYPDR